MYIITYVALLLAILWCVSDGYVCRLITYCLDSPRVYSLVGNG